MNGPVRAGDRYRFDRSRDGQVEHFCINAVDEQGALDEAEYLLNPENSAVPDNMSGTLWRVDGGRDVRVADVGPLDFGGSTRG